jgi:hypothetical protein
MGRPFILAAIVVASGAIVASAAGDEGILKLLARISTQNIPQVNCDVNGGGEVKDGKRIYPSVSVGDFIASYVAWSLTADDRSGCSMKCEGKGVLNCTFSYGEKPADKEPGWRRTLQFRVDEKTRKVDGKSLKCMEVP